MAGGPSGRSSLLPAVGRCTRPFIAQCHYLRDPARLPGVVAQTLAAGTWNCPTLVVLDRFAALEDLEALKRRVQWLDKIPPAIVAQWDPKQDFRLRTYTAEDYATLRAGNAQRAKILAALAAANAPLLVGTDTGNPFVVPGAALHDEIELMVAAGLPRAVESDLVEPPLGILLHGGRSDKSSLGCWRAVNDRESSPGVHKELVNLTLEEPFCRRQAGSVPAPVVEHLVARGIVASLHLHHVSTAIVDVPDLVLLPPLRLGDPGRWA